MFSAGFSPPDAQEVTALYLALTLLVCAARWRRRRARRERTLTPEERHAAHVARSRRTLRAARRDPEGRLTRLRAVHPHEFEEVVLTALERRGHRIRRNAAYTGDGGIDGQVWVRGRRFLVQSKRYKGAIRAEHIEEFARVCRRARARGLFVHTGRMGPKSVAADEASRRVVVLHGEALERLVAGQRVRVGGVRL